MTQPATKQIRSIARTSVALALCAFLLAGCRQSQDKPKEEKAITGESKTFTRGPATLTVETDKTKLSIAERLKLVLTVVVEPGHKVKMPEFGEKLDQFAITNYRAPEPELLDDKKVRYVREYELEPFLSGDYTIPSMKAEFWEEGKPDKIHHVESEEMTVKVTSVIDDPSKMQLKDIAPPVEPKREFPIWPVAIVGGGIAVLFLILTLVVFLKNRKAKDETEVRRDPADIAYDELEALVGQGLVEKGEIKLFYLGLSGILRHYIENRFALRAPERTTEEFLTELRKTDVLSDAQKDLLKRFLQHCDMVKFAEHRAENAEIQATFDTCKAFIEETREGGNAVQ